MFDDILGEDFQRLWQEATEGISRKLGDQVYWAHVGVDTTCRPSWAGVDFSAHTSEQTARYYRTSQREMRQAANQCFLDNLPFMWQLGAIARQNPEILDKILTESQFNMLRTLVGVR